MKKVKKIAAALAGFAMLFGTVLTACSSDDGDEYYAVESVSLTSFKDTISLNNVYSVSPVFTPSNATDKNFTISVDQDWVTVDNTSHTVKPTKEGTFNLTVTSAADSTKTDKKTITVKTVELTGISLALSDPVYIESSANISITYTPSDASYKDLTWSSSDTDIATVINGVVSGVAEGTTTITAKSSKYENISNTLSVTVSEMPETTIKIQENASAGFVNTTGKVKTEFGGYSGNGYIDNVTNGGSIVYIVDAKRDLTDAKIALHYLATETTRVRGAFVTVNETLLNETKPFAMATDKKIEKTKATSSDWKDTGYLENVSLKKGLNTIIVTGASAGTYTAVNGKSITIAEGDSGCLNYVDYLIVVGKGISAGSKDAAKSYYTLSYSSENTTGGSVDGDVASGSVEDGTSVTLTAKPNDGWKFECWTDGSNENPYKFKVSGNKYVMAHFVREDYTAPAGLVGYASVTSDSAAAYTITGGDGASSSNIVTISSYEDLTSTYASLISGDEPAIITISGTISTASNPDPLMSVNVNVGSNKTICGDTTNQGRLRNIELNIEGENIIVRNLMLGEVIGWDFQKHSSGANDAMCLNGATHVWIDHCEFQSHLTPQDLDGNEITSNSPYYSSEEKWTKDFYDGLLDIKNGSTWITISNCYFHNHWKAVLCASGDEGPDANKTTGATDEDMRVTFYGNYWKNISARQPMFRYGKAHVANSYFETDTSESRLYSSGGNVNTTAINCRAGSEVYIDNNTFKNIKTPIGFYNNTSTAKTGSWTNVNNSFESCTNPVESSSTSYRPPYNWNASRPASAPTPGKDVGVGCSLN